MSSQRSGFLLTFPVLVELSTEATPDDPDSPLWDLADRIQTAINELVEPDREDLGCHQSIVRDLQERSANAGRCARCSAWTTDWLAPNPIEALRRGLTVNGELLCEDELGEEQMARLYPEAGR